MERPPALPPQAFTDLVTRYNQLNAEMMPFKFVLAGVVDQTCAMTEEEYRELAAQRNEICGNLLDSVCKKVHCNNKKQTPFFITGVVNGHFINFRGIDSPKATWSSMTICDVEPELENAELLKRRSQKYAQLLALR